ncbi:hypothetical protein HRG_000757 [Hirsutella rhossiliensis]|uniref:Uncharacterized protein n=1 Tax=Hirsutella rhossiliensis TaxID=111463 RepID=A0A9P8N704_9HYPO|nr:uncharacterized protein HRG_00757 [Hirsutella rhossiliensis]KAH0968115.1 hypothetical protein HRG_00757 [Hirsutella rhossiliensis]
MGAERTNQLLRLPNPPSAPHVGSLCRVVGPRFPQSPSSYSLSPIGQGAQNPLERVVGVDLLMQVCLSFWVETEPSIRLIDTNLRKRPAGPVGKRQAEATPSRDRRIKSSRPVLLMTCHLNAPAREIASARQGVSRCRSWSVAEASWVNRRRSPADVAFLPSADKLSQLF